MSDTTNMNDFFGFDETDISDTDFFAVEEEEQKKPEGGDPNPEDSRDEEEQEEEEENLFAESEEEEQEEEEEEQEEESGKDKTSVNGESISTLAYLKEKGLVDYQLEEGETLTNEKAEELLEDSLDNLFEDRIEELFEDVPDVLKQMNKFVLKGGDINVFLSNLTQAGAGGLTKDMDLEDESNQELVIRNSLKEEGYDNEYIEAQIEFLKDSKRLQKHSKTLYSKWEEKENQKQTALLKAEEKRVNDEKIQRRELKNRVSSFLKENEEITGFTVTKDDIKSLPNYMSDRNIKLDNGNTITSMQRDLMRVLNSPTGSIQMAKLLKAATDKGELSFDEIATNTETKVTKKVRENVRRNKNSIITQSGQGFKQKRLADYFD